MLTNPKGKPSIEWRALEVRSTALDLFCSASIVPSQVGATLVPVKVLFDDFSCMFGSNRRI